MTGHAHARFFGGYDSPVLGLTARRRTRDFASLAKARGLPPFAVCLHALARASLDVPEFRLRLNDGAVETIDRLVVSYTVDGRGDRINFSTFDFSDDFDLFLARYLADREPARTAETLRLAPMDHRGFLFVTCLPWMAFTAIQHPVARFADCSIPMVAVGQFERDGADLTFPLNVQVHHGLVDAVHVARYMARVDELLNRVCEVA